MKQNLRKDEKNKKLPPPHFYLDKIRISAFVLLVIMLFGSNIVKAQWNNNGSDIYFDTGNVGIGSNLAPMYSLHLYNSTLSDNKIIVENNYTVGYGIDGILLGINQLTGYINLPQDRTLNLMTFNTARLTILGDGNIGINNTNPTVLFDISGGDIAIRNNFAINRVLTSDATGVGTWQELTLSLSSNILTINGFGNVNLSNYLDNTDNQVLYLTNNKLSITNSTDSVDLSSYIKLTESEVDNYVSNNGYLTSEADADPTNELQQLSINSGQLEISNGNSIPISSLNINIWQQNTNNDTYYNTGNVGIGLTTPASNLHLHNTQTIPFYKALPSGGGNQEDDPPVSQHVTTTFQLTNTNTGEEESDGLVIQSSDYDAIFNLQEDGNMSFITNKNTGLYLKNTGNVGIGTTTPQSCLHIHNSTPASGGGVGAVSQIGKSGEGIVTIQLTNAITGTSQSDGLFISAKQNNAIINLNETGSFDIKLKDQTAFKIYENKDVQIPSLSGAGFRVVVADFSGKLKADMLLSDLSKWQENGNKLYYNDGFVGIGIDNPTHKLDINGNIKIRKSDLVLGTNDDREQGSNHKNRALVHGSNDELIINYAGDFEGGILIPTEHDKLPNIAQLTIKGNGGNAMGDAYISFYEGAETNSIWSVGVKDIGNMFAISNSLLITDEPKFVILEDNGNVGIGTITPREKLTVKGKILSEENIVVYDANTSEYDFPDYVFDDDYKPISLDELEKFIINNNHLPEIPTTADVTKDGIKLGEMNIKLLKKVEELTLYTIEQEKAIIEQQELYKQQQELIELLLKRIEKLEEDK